MRAMRSSDAQAGPAGPAIPEERQGWAGEGYEGGQDVLEAEPPSWGPNGYAGTAPGRVAETGGEPLDPATARTEDAGPGDDDPGPGTHPASVIAGR